MSTNNSTLTGYKIDYANQTITLNYKFNKAAQIYHSEQFNLLQELEHAFPHFKVVIQSGRVQKETNKNKRLTYENMETYISTYENSKELLAMFETVKMMSKPLASPYKYVRDWFKAQFPNHDKPSAIDTIKPRAKLLSAPNVDNYQAKQESEQAAGT